MTLDAILDMTFDQISLCSNAVMSDKVEMLNMIFEPISAAFGSKKSKSKLHKYSEKKEKPNEDAKLAQLKFLGIDVSDI